MACKQIQNISTFLLSVHSTKEEKFVTICLASLKLDSLQQDIVAWGQIVKCHVSFKTSLGGRSTGQHIDSDFLSVIFINTHLK